MRPVLLVIVVMLVVGWSGEAGATEPGYRFQALMDLDRNVQTGCALQTSAGEIQGNEARVYALTDRQRVQLVVHEVCRDGAWKQVEPSVPLATSAFVAGAHGSDAIDWSVSLDTLGPLAELPIRILAESTTSAAFDVVGAGPTDFTLNVGHDAGAPKPIPALGFAGALLLVATLLIGVRYAAPAWELGRKPWVIAGFLLLVQSANPPQTNAIAAPPPAQVIVEDPPNDVLPANAGVDVLRVIATSEPGRVNLYVEVNNIDDDALPDGARVLFLGNSLTYFNDLPLMVKAIARQAGKSLAVASVTYGGVNLEDLYRRTDALAEISRGRYDLVVMQQGPSSLAASQVDLRRWTVNFETPIRASGARPALYMVWPDETRLAFFDDVRASYRNAALDVHGMFIPAGETWRRAWRTDASLPLYDDDRFHPSALGSYAAALTLFSAFYRQTPVGLPATLTLENGSTLKFPEPAARVLQESAWLANLEHGIAGE